MLTTRTILGLMLTALLLYLLTFHGLGQRELWSSHEGRAAQDAQSILDGGDWRLPRLFDGRPELQKPPLYYWLTAAMGWLRGSVDEVAVRLPAVLGFILTGVAIGLFLLRQGQQRAACFAMVILWTMLHFTWMSRVGRIDMPLTAACTWCIVSFILGQQRTGWPRHGWWLLGYLALAAGLMLKGPIALALVGIVMLPVLAWQWKVRLQEDAMKVAPLLISACWGIPLVLACILPWAYWVNQATSGQFVQEFIIKHNVQRGFGGDDQLDGHVHPWWFYLARIWLDTAPWSWLLPMGIVMLWRKQLQSPVAWLGLTWFGVIFLLLSCLQYKRADYLLPAYPGLAIFLAMTVDRGLQLIPEQRRLGTLRSGWAMVAVIAVGWFSYAQWVLPSMEPERALRPFAIVVRSHLPAPGQVILFRVDSHHLAWELGKKSARVWEWENLAWWATQPNAIYVVMPEKYALECRAALPAGELIRLGSTKECNQGVHDVPLVLFVNGAGRAVAQR